MKYLLLLIIILISSSTYLLAQTGRDSTNLNVKALPQKQKSHSIENMVRVDINDVPAALKATLSRGEYLGWEKGTLYLNKKTKEYALLMPDRETEGLKQNKEIMGKKTPVHTGWYYFTAEGKVIDN